MKHRFLLVFFAVLCILCAVPFSTFAQDIYDQSFHLNLPLTIDNLTKNLSLDFVLRNQAGTDKLTISNINANGFSGITYRTTDYDGTIVFSPGDYPGAVYTLNVNKNNQWTLSQNLSGYMGTVTPSSGKADKSGNLTTAAVLYTVRDVVFNIQWVDLHSEIRPEINLTLYQSLNGGPFVPLSVAIPTPVQEEYHFVYTFEDQLGAAQYELHEDSISGYRVSPESGIIAENETLTNTQITEVTFTKEWLDAAHPGSRPSPADYAAGLTLARTNLDDPTPELLPDASATVTESADGLSWTISFGEYEKCNNVSPYQYLILEDSAWNVPDEYGYYTLDSGLNTVTIDGNTYISDGSATKATLTQDTEFHFSKLWLDGGTLPENRPDATIYLYRYPNDGKSDTHSLSPIKGMDHMALNTTDLKQDLTDITYLSNGKTILPRYDAEGNEYIYIAIERLSDEAENQEYISEVYRGGVKIAGSMAQNGDSFINRLSSSTRTEATKSWDFPDSDYIFTASVSLALYRSANGGAEELVDENALTISGFDSTHITLKEEYPQDVDKYDPNGYLYQYTFVERSGILNGEAYTVNPDGTFSVGGHDFVSSQGFIVDPKTGQRSEALINKMADKTTSMIVTKSWQPALADPLTASIDIALYTADDASYIDLSDCSISIGALNPDQKSLHLSGADWINAAYTTVIDGLPRFADDGTEIKYLVKELALTSDPAYFHAHTYYRMENNVRHATIINTNQPGVSYISFEIFKEWQDNEDTDHRKNVLVGIYYKDDPATPVSPSPVELSEANSWYRYVVIKDTVGDPEYRDITNWSVREISAGAYPVDYPNGTDQAGTYTDEYNKYLVENELTYSEGSDSQWTITNTKTGLVDITIIKDWQVGSLEWLGETGDITADFTLTKYDETGAELDEQIVTLIKDGSPVTISDLPKTDEHGNPYYYVVTETALAQGSKRCVFNAEGICNFGGTEIKGVETNYTYTLNPIGKDSAVYEFLNKESDTIRNLSVNVVWRDTTEHTRPDVALKVYRIPFDELTYTAEDLNNAEDVSNDVAFLWDSSHGWYWTCNFGKVARFNADGKKYAYLVTESFPHPLNYSYTFFGEGGTMEQPSAAGTDAKSTFVVHTEEGKLPYAFAGVLENHTTGTIINTPYEERSIPGVKKWNDLPQWFDYAILKPIYVYLFRTLDKSVIDDVTGFYADEYQVTDESGNPLRIKLDHGVVEFTFDDMPVYDIYGNKYYYFVGEKNENGTINRVFSFRSILPKPNAPTVDIVNVYTGEGTREKITVNKTWEWGIYTDRVKFGDKTPSVQLILHQYWSNGTYVNDIPYKTKVIESMDIDETAAPTTVVFDDADIYLYAPDGTPYVYYVTEEAVDGEVLIDGYNVTYPNGGNTVGDPIIFTQSVSDPTLYEGSIEILNTYDPQIQPNKTFTKIWNDQNNLYGTRPDFTDIAMTLKRGVPGQTATDYPFDSGNWIGSTGATAPQWTYEFTGEFPTFKKDSTRFEYIAYDYFVTPGDAIPGYQSESAKNLTVTNNLEYIPLRIRKQWSKTVDGGSEILSVNDMKNLLSLHALGLIADQLTFYVYRWDKNTGAWESAPLITRQIPFIDIYASAVHGDLISLTDDAANRLLKYYPGTTELIRYKVVEETSDFNIEITPEIFADPADCGSCSGDSMSCALCWCNTPNTCSAYTASVKNVMKTNHIQAHVAWDDQNNRDGLRPESVTLTVSVTPAGGVTKTYTEVLTREKNYSTTIAIPYGAEFTLTQVDVPSYTHTPSQFTKADGNDFTFTNIYAPTTFGVGVNKLWNDQNNKWQLRPAQTNLHLEYCESGTACDTAGTTAVWQILSGSERLLTSTSTPAWSDAGWSGLYVNNSKTEAQAWNTVVKTRYRVVEDPIPSPYKTASAVFTDSAAADVAVKIENTQETTQFSVNKVWSDINNADNTRPTSLTVTLQQSTDGTNWIDCLGGTEQYTFTAPSWSAYTFTGLPKADATGAVLRYRAVEKVEPSGYAKSESTAGGATTITNTLSIDVPVHIHWIGTEADYPRPDAGVTVRLSDGTAVFPHNFPKGQTDYTYLDLPVYAPDDHAYVYTLTEDTVAGYNTYIVRTESGAYDVSFDVYNIPTIAFEAFKIWKDGADKDHSRPLSIDVTLTGGAAPWTAQLTPPNWHFTFTGLPKYNFDGDIIPYAITENGVPGVYKTEISGSTITNTLLTDLTVKKNWNYGSDPLPTFDIPVTLYGPDGTEIEVGVLNPANGWQYTFTGLRKYDDANNTIIYTAKEAPNSAWSTEYSDPDRRISGDSPLLTLKNTELTSVTLSQRWVDGSNAEGERADKITLKLLADGVPIQSVDLSDSADTWTTTISALPKFTPDGKLISYTATEPTGLSGYVTERLGDTSFKSTQVCVISVKKIWQDGDGSIRPDKVEIALTGGPTDLFASLTKPNWDHNFVNLPKYSEDGHPYTYSLMERTPSGYKSVIEGYQIRSFIPINITITKIWDDEVHRFGKRTPSVKLYLLADGVPLYEKEVTEADNWTWEITGLPVHAADGHVILYEPEEDTPPEYTKIIDGMTITNYYRKDESYLNFFTLGEEIDMLELPATGFSTKHPTLLPSASVQYRPTSLHLEIPSLFVSHEILEIPLADQQYPVEYLGMNLGIPQGFARPGEGPTIIVGHNHLETMDAGPFAQLWTLSENDRIFVTDKDGNLRVFSVFANQKIDAHDFATVKALGDSGENVLILLTCEDERPEGGYASRRVVVALPVD